MLLIFPMCYVCIRYIREINVNNLVLSICIGLLAFSWAVELLAWERILANMCMD